MNDKARNIKSESTANQLDALMPGLACQLILNKRITTTLAKAKALAKYIQPILAISKVDNTENRLFANDFLKNNDASSELFIRVGPQMLNRTGRYTRITKLPQSSNDIDVMATIELADFSQNLVSTAKSSFRNDIVAEPEMYRQLAPIPKGKLLPQEFSKEKESLNHHQGSIVLDKSTEFAIHILGIKDATIHSLEGWIQIVRNGITMKALHNLMAHTSITLEEMATYTHVDKKLLENYNSRKKLNTLVSERAAEIANMYGKGVAVLGNLIDFNVWMNQPLIPLGNKKPKELLDTSFGIQMIMDELGRLEHGIFA